MVSYVVVDTGQTKCYYNRSEITCTQPGRAFYGQDAQYQGKQMSYQDNGDGTMTDRDTGLMWTKADSGGTANWEKALGYPKKLKYARYDDWRLPNAKELQSIVDYTRVGVGFLLGPRKAVVGWFFRLERAIGASFIGKYAFFTWDLGRKLYKFSKKVIVTGKFDDYYR